MMGAHAPAHHHDHHQEGDAMTPMTSALLELDWTADAQGAAPAGSRLANWLALDDQHPAIERAVSEEHAAAWLAAVLHTARESRGVLSYADRLRGIKIDLQDEAVTVTIAVLPDGRARLPLTHGDLPVRTWSRSAFGGLRAPETLGPDGRAIAIRSVAEISFPLDLTVASSVMTSDENALPTAARQGLQDLAAQINRLASPLAATLVDPAAA
jgi:hypothetical protein